MTVSLELVLGVVAGLAAGALGGWWLARSRAALAAAVAEGQAREAITRLETELAKEREAHAGRLAALHDAEDRLSKAFASLSGRALDDNSKRFLDLASSTFGTLKADASGDLAVRQAEIAGIVSPMKEALGKIAQTLAEVERVRGEDKGRLLEQLGQVQAAHQALEGETRKLVRALQVPHVRGRWGELQLQRVVELAGMEEYCDFRLQPSVQGESGTLRPDLIVTLPGGRTVVVDAKAPVTAYLDAVAATDDAEREARMRDHAARVKAHVAALGAKAYWTQFEATPDFVVLFLPGESFFSAAVQYDPGLFEYGAAQRVFLAGPFTLLALLRTVAHGWKQEQLAENARKISDAGKELYDRLATLAGHFASLRERLQAAVEVYNQAIASLETRLLPAARRFRDLGVTSTKEIAALEPIAHTPRRLQAAEMASGQDRQLVDGEVIVPAGGDALQPRNDE